MIPRPHVDWFALAPELVLLGAMAFALMGAVLLPRENRRDFGALAAALGFAGAFVYAIVVYVHTPDVHSVIADSVRRDRFGALAQVIVCGAGLLTVGVSYAERMRDEHIAEYYAVLAAAGGGMCFLVTANNLMTLFLGLEWFSISLYILCAIDRELEGSLEAGLKYLIIGGFGSAVLLFGSALVYGATGELAFNRISDAIGAQHLAGDALLVAGLAMIIVGLGFKASAAPFHMWTPDVYEGAPPVTLDNLAGMGWERPLLGVAMGVFMFGFAGLPPTGGFVGKFYAFSAAYRHGWTWLVIVGVAATAVSLYYYLAVVRAMYMRPAAELQLTPATPVVGGAPPRDALLQTSVLLALGVTVGSFVAVEPLIHVAKHAAGALPF